MILKSLRNFLATSLLCALFIPAHLETARANNIPESEEPIKLAIYE